MTFADLLAGSLLVVVFANLLDLASSAHLSGWAQLPGRAIRHITDPDTPLVPWPPGDPRHGKE